MAAWKPCRKPVLGVVIMIVMTSYSSVVNSMNLCDFKDISYNLKTTEQTYLERNHETTSKGHFEFEDVSTPLKTTEQTYLERNHETTSKGHFEFEDVSTLLKTTEQTNLGRRYQTETKGSSESYSSEKFTKTNPICPANMVYTTCTCQGTCEEPLGCHYNCTQPEACVCPKGFLMQDGDCMPQRSCPCFIEEAGLIRNGTTFVGSNCSMICACVNNELFCNHEYSCSNNGECIKIDHKHQCICKTGYLGDGQTCTRPVNCSDLYQAGYTNDGVYTMLPTDWPGLPFDVFCNMSEGVLTSQSGYIQSTLAGSTEDSTTTTPSCPLNMIFSNCSCQGTCQDPSKCLYNCTRPEGCVCPEGFLMLEGDCVPQTTCPCYIENVGVIPTGVTYVGPNCSMNCTCHSDNLICENEYSCSFNGQCVEENQTSRCVCQGGFIGDGQICTRLIDCYEWYKAGNGDDGVYTILPAGWPGLPFEVFCDMSGGGWTVFQHRFDGSVDFYRDWESYKHGFGDLKTEFWLGNEKLFYFTTQGNYQLRIDLMNKFGNMYLAVFDLFRINNENDNYRLIEVGNYQGNADTTGTGYPLSYHRGQSFSTYDRDNDKDYFNCALGKKGAWWYKNCYASNLNGLYTTPYDSESINWYNLPGYNAQVKYTQMKLQRV